MALRFRDVGCCERDLFPVYSNATVATLTRKPMGSLKRLSKMSVEYMGFKRKVRLDGMVFLPQPG